MKKQKNLVLAQTIKNQAKSEAKKRKQRRMLKREGLH